MAGPGHNRGATRNRCGLLIAAAAIRLDLYVTGYRSIPVIGGPDGGLGQHGDRGDHGTYAAALPRRPPPRSLRRNSVDGQAGLRPQVRKKRPETDTVCGSSM